MVDECNSGSDKPSSYSPPSSTNSAVFVFVLGFQVSYLVGCTHLLLLLLLLLLPLFACELTKSD
jgi:hypothetical protein